jgi:hypothetical protein
MELVLFRLLYIKRLSSRVAVASNNFSFGLPSITVA